MDKYDIKATCPVCNRDNFKPKMIVPLGAGNQVVIYDCKYCEHTWREIHLDKEAT